jgi:hypothetical protein
MKPFKLSLGTGHGTLSGWRGSLAHFVLDREMLFKVLVPTPWTVFFPNKEHTYHASYAGESGDLRQEQYIMPLAG